MIIIYEKKEQFILYHINQLLDFNFGRKFLKSRTLKLTSLTRLLLVAKLPTFTPSVLVSFISSLLTIGPSIVVLLYIPICSCHYQA